MNVRNHYCRRGSSQTEGIDPPYEPWRRNRHYREPATGGEASIVATRGIQTSPAWPGSMQGDDYLHGPRFRCPAGRHVRDSEIMRHRAFANALPIPSGKLFVAWLLGLVRKGEKVTMSDAWIVDELSHGDEQQREEQNN